MFLDSFSALLMGNQDCKRQAVIRQRVLFIVLPFMAFFPCINKVPAHLNLTAIHWLQKLKIIKKE